MIKIDKEMDKLKEISADRQTDRQTDRQSHRQTVAHTCMDAVYDSVWCEGVSHAVPGSQVSVNKHLLCQILHSSGDLGTHPQQQLTHWENL